jgi:UDP-N-acetylmuramate: L-alanyl-gamma-D-glutamyl-meso-diaminopimelate ligase
MNLSFKDLLDRKNSIKKVFFFRICGTGMGAAAYLLKNCGFDVEGADSNFYPPMSEYLQTLDIPMHKLEELTKEQLEEFDLVVVGNVVARSSKDAEFLESLDVALASFPATLGSLVFSDKNMVGISGTHGKTTTTYFFTQVFKELGLDPGYLIGGVLPGQPISHSGSKYFFIEADEYDSSYFEKFSKFRSYDLNHLIVTSLEFDHADIFDNLSQIEDQFLAVMENLNGTLIYNSDYSSLKKISAVYNQYKNKISYGQKDKHGPTNIVFENGHSRFEIEYSGTSYSFETNIAGTHNILNLSTVILFALSEGFLPEEINRSIKKLKLVKRRQEVRGLFQGAIVIDDFAHHPTAVSSTLESLSKVYQGKKLKVVLEPNSATARSNIFQNEFSSSFQYCDELVVAKPLSHTSVKQANDLDCDQLAKDVNSKYSINANVVKNLPELRERISVMADKDSVIAFLSNGTCLGLWNSDFVDQLDSYEI